MTHRRFNDWRDELSDSLLSIYTEALNAVEPQAKAARQRGDLAGAEEITSAALERAQPAVLAEFDRRIAEETARRRAA